MIITADSITLSFLVVSAVALAVVSVLVWYVYSSRKFKDDVIKMMDEKLETYLDNLEPPKKGELDKMYEEFKPKDETEFAEKAEQTEQEEVAKELPQSPQSFVEKPFVEKPQ